VCRILESLFLWSNGEGRSAGRILAWAVRPRECELKAISAEGAADIVACILAGNISQLTRANRLIYTLSGWFSDPPRLQRWTFMGTFPWA
jgi:hypothetical protein